MRLFVFVGFAVVSSLGLFACSTEDAQDSSGVASQEVRQRGEEGDDCDDHKKCEEGLVCKPSAHHAADEDESAGKCKKPAEGTAGAICGRWHQCKHGFTCHITHEPARPTGTGTPVPAWGVCEEE